MHLVKLLAAQFPGLPLEPPLFYRWTAALRFELNIKRDNPPDFESIAHRASTLYESAFAASDVAYILSVTKHFAGSGHQRPFGYQGHDDRRLFSLARKNRLGISRPSGVAKRKHTRKEIDDWGASRTRIEWAELAPLDKSEPRNTPPPQKTWVKSGRGPDLTHLFSGLSDLSTGGGG